jgi:hypothetical protein
MKSHVTVVAMLHIGLGVLGVLVALIVFVAVVGGGLLSGDHDAIVITRIVGSVLASFFVLISAPSIIGGIGLLRGASWARVLVMILAVFQLFNVPIGTALAIYTFWVLMQEETTRLFSRPRGRDVDQIAQY